MANKETGKKAFEFKRRYIVYIIIGTVVFSVVGALTINLLYSLGKNGNAIHTEWQASDTLIFFATVLEALGTISLGAISIWQNVQLQKANEESQNRLENISKHANEINQINMIVERENSRIKRFIAASDEFEDYAIFLKSVEQIREGQSVDYNIRLSKLNVFKSSQRVLSELASDIVNRNEAKDLVRVIKQLRKASDNINELILSGVSEIPKEAIDGLSDNLSDFINTKDKYIIHSQLWINEIMLGKRDFDDIKKIYEKIIKEDSNGQTENDE